MADLNLTASVRPAGKSAVIDLKGDINAAGDAALNAAYTQASATGAKTIVLNFSAVDYINSTGIALIVGLLVQARRNDQKLLTTGLSSHYLEIFRITRLSDFMTIHADEASALAEAQEN
jgi:anti-sigma B factor antagonist